MQGLSHFNKLYLVDESYTTKTCDCCGNKNNNVGSSHIYKCNYGADRDIHGVRNIWIKTYTENGTMMHVPQTIANTKYVADRNPYVLTVCSV